MSKHLTSIYNWGLRLLSFFLLLTALTACQDDPLFDYEEGDLDGFADLRLSFAFKPMEVADLGSRSQTDLIEDITDLSVLIYDTSGSLIPGGYHYLQLNTDFRVNREVDADQNDYSGTSTTVKTCRATVTYPINVPRGKYRIYAVANMGDMEEQSQYKEKIKEESKMRTIQLQWDSNTVGNNCQMSGWFHKHKEDSPNTHTEDDEPYPSSLSNGIVNVPVITITGNMTLHAWLRRAVAKVTIAYDATGLYDDTWIYLRSVSIRNLPKECSLVANNSVEPPTPAPADTTSEKHRKTDLVKGETHFYSGETEATYVGKEKDYSGYASWPFLANGKAHFGVHERTYKDNGKVDEEPVALYSYENLQGQGNDKHQVMKDEDPEDLVYTYRDKNSVGTFIEVDGYYISNKEGNESSGPIKYRFMLGKDISENYDLERNYHYKVTLVFHGAANNIDWHIDYQEEEKPGIYAPDSYYVSYLYGSEMEYPVRVEGKITSSYIDITIDRNDWRPWDEYANDGKGDYPADTQENWAWWGKGNYTLDEVTPVGETDPLWKGPEGTAVWNGFLSLYNTLGHTSMYKPDGYQNGDWNKKDWYKITLDSGIDAESYGDRPKQVTYRETNGGTATTVTTYKDEGYRRYKVPEQNGTYEYYSVGGESGQAQGYGKYRVVKKDNVTTFYIPLYTRPLVMTTWSSYTGNNPFYSFMRRARVVISAEINDKPVTKKKTVFQVRRQINPKVIMRRHNNTNCFTVELTHRTGEDRNHRFVSFNSRGPWSASIIQGGDGWEIVGRSSGKTETPVKFTVRPRGVIGPHENKCAMVEVWYHSHSCRHVIFLRQGYAPIDMSADREYQSEDVPARADTKLWHSFNLWWVDGDGPRLTDCPIEDGSFFRRANYTTAIDPINGNISADPALTDYNKAGRYNQDGTMRNIDNPGYGYFWLAPIKNKQLAKWQYKNPTSGVIETDGAIKANSGAFSNLTLTLKSNNSAKTPYNVTVFPPALEDWECFVNNPNIELGFGIAYGDGASGMQYDPDHVFRHSYVSKMPLLDENSVSNASKYCLTDFNIVGEDPNGTYGVRACCVVNKNTGALLVLPLGHTGFGHRCNRFAYSAIRKAQHGELRYSQRDGFLPATANLNERPLLYTININYGAIYWTDAANDAQTAWDINYTTFDFNTYFSNGSSDGNFIRLVQYKTNSPTETQPYWDYNQSQKTTRPGF